MNFIREFYKHLSLFPIEDLRLLVLFGSQVRGDATEKSDIDLLIVFRKALTENDRKKLYEIETLLTEKFKRKVDLLVCGPNLEEIFTNLWSEICADGIILYGIGLLDPREKTDLVAYRLIAYDTSNLLPIMKARLSRALFGYETQVKGKGKKRYRYRRQGALERSLGFRVDLSVLMCPAQRSGEILQVLRMSKAGFTQRLVFLERFQDEPIQMKASKV